MEDVPLGRIAALVPEFAVKDLSLSRTMMMMMMMMNLGHGTHGFTSLPKEFILRIFTL